MAQSDGEVIQPHTSENASIKPEPALLDSEQALPEPSSDYGTARIVAKVVSLLGWVVVVAGIVGIAYGVRKGLLYGGRDAVLIAVTPGMATVMMGIVMVVMGQITRATVNTADDTRQILHLFRHGKH